MADETTAGLIARLRTVQDQLNRLEIALAAWDDNDAPARELIAHLRRHGLIRNP